MSLVLTLFYLGIVAGTGYAALSAVMGGQRRHWAEIGGMSFACGAGIWGIGLFVASVMGHSPSRGILALFGVVVIGILVFMVLGSKTRPLKRLGRAGVGDDLKLAGRRDVRRVLGIFAAVVIVLTSANVVAEAMTPGIGDIDSFAIWMFKAKIGYEQALWPLPGALHDPQLSFSHQDYPLGFPLLVSGAYAAVGGIDVLMAKLVLLPIYFSLVAVVYSALRRRIRRADAIVVTAIFVSIPVLRQHAGMAVAEVLLVLMHTCCLVWMLEWMETGKRVSLVFAGAFAAFAAFTKNEGLALLPLLGMAALAVAMIRRRGKMFLDVAAAGGVALGILLPWLIYRRFLPYTHENYGAKLSSWTTVANDFSRLGVVVPPYLARLVEFNTGGLIWVVLVATAVVGWRGFGRLPVVVLWFILLGHLGLYAATFMVTPWNLDVLIPMVSAKLLIHVAPAAVLLVGLHMSAFEGEVPLRGDRYAGELETVVNLGRGRSENM